jgi:2-amino-4-hydroxy-6-hydroxymethyldihydropteridine diphosphokinase
VTVAVSRAYIGLGSNLGDRVATLADALASLDAERAVRVVAVSSVYESEPWGVAEQPAFANAVAALDTSLRAHELLALLQRIEVASGRVPGTRNGPRVLDLDLLSYGGTVSHDPMLVLPHPRLRERDFVVTPLLEIAPEIRLPDRAPVDRHGAVEGRVTGVLVAAPWYPPQGGPTAARWPA